MQTKTEKLADTRTASERAAGVLSPVRRRIPRAVWFHRAHQFGYRRRL
jgi:hypothetical protein